MKNPTLAICVMLLTSPAVACSNHTQSAPEATYTNVQTYHAIPSPHNGGNCLLGCNPQPIAEIHAMPIQYLSTTPNPPMIHAPAPARTQTYAPRPRVYTQVIQRQLPWGQVQTLGNYAPTTIRNSGNTWNFAPRIALDLSHVSSRASSRVSNRSSQSSVVNEIVRQAMPTMATVMGVNND